MGLDVEAVLMLLFGWFDRGISRLSGRTPQPELHSRDWQWLVRTGISTFLYTFSSLILIDFSFMVL